MNSEIEPRPTFWSVPPFRQRARTALRTLKVRDCRLLMAEMYGLLYFQYGMKLPVIIFVSSFSLFGPAGAVGFPVKSLWWFLVSAIAAAAVAAATAWFVTGRAAKSRRPNSVRWAIWGALAAGAPLAAMVAIVPAHAATGGLSLVILLLLGAAVATVLSWVVQRDQRESELREA